MSKTANSIKDRLLVTNFKLNTLLEITNAINENRSKEELFQLVKDVMISKLNIGKFVLYTYDDQWELSSIYGTDEATLSKINIEKDLRPIEEITVLNTHENKDLEAFDVVMPITHHNKALAYILLGDFAGEKIEVSPIIRHLRFIQTLANIVIVAIQNKKLTKENIRQAAIKKEMDLAQEMQSMLFPTEFPDDDKLDIAAFYRPHLKVGGDYYDFIRLNDEEVIFCIADVSGKGVSAALLMSNFQANLRALATNISSLEELVKALNTKVLSSAKGEKFITLFIAKYNEITRTLRFVNAGHNPPLYFSNGKLIELEAGSTILGMFEELPSVEGISLSVAKNSVLFCYTDGLVELENQEEDEFGLDRLGKVIAEYSRGDVETLVNQVFHRAKTFKGEMPYVDDIALLACKFK